MSHRVRPKERLGRERFVEWLGKNGFVPTDTKEFKFEKQIGEYKYRFRMSNFKLWYDVFDQKWIPLANAKWTDIWINTDGICCGWFYIDKR